MIDNSPISKMTFTAYADAGCTEGKALKDDKGVLTYVVITNPDHFDRTLAPKQAAGGGMKQSSSEKKYAGLESEKYSFELLLDGTGVVDPKRKDVAQELKDFLRVVYVSPSNSNQTNYVAISYCGERFCCKMTNMTIKYSLFNRDGTPLRLKINCSFESVSENKKDKNGKKKTKSGSGGEKKQEDKDQTQNSGRCGGGDSFMETLKQALGLGSESLLRSGK